MRAQEPAPDPSSSARLHLGPAALTPTITLKNVGLDSNVFNAVENPRSDFTATVGAEAQLWMHLGPARLSNHTAVDYVHFRRYASERAVNASESARIELPLTRFTPYGAALFQTVRDRPGYEIDARARHHEYTLQAGSTIVLGSRLGLDVSGRQTRYVFKGDAAFEGTYLSQTLNRTANTLNATATYAVTPLTRVLLVLETASDRFEFSHSRDNQNVRVAPGVMFSPSALITGSAFVGFRRIDSNAGGLPDFAGVIAAIDLGYVFRGNTRFGVSVERDIQYSFEDESPYYLLHGTTVSVTQRVQGSWDVTGRVSAQRLSYRPAERRDTLQIYSAGFGYRVRDGMRIGIEASSYRRRSIVQRRDYEAVRVASTMTYGF